MAGLVGDPPLQHDQAQVAVIEEPAHAAAATMMALVAVEAERMAAEGRAVMTAVAAVVVGMTSKHVGFRSCFPLYRNSS